jgi:lipopolysaccharide export system protein LptA
MMAMGLFRITVCMAMASLFATAVTPVLAQNKPTRVQGLALSKNKPIQIEADKLEIHEQDKQALFDGKVKVVQGTTTLNADHMIVFYKGDSTAVTSGKGDIDRIEVNGSVTVFSGDQTARGDKGSFDMLSELLVLTGKQVVLTAGNNVSTGCKLTVEMKNGLARLESCGKRIQMSIDPQSNQN